MQQLEQQGRTVVRVWVWEESRLVGLLGLADQPKPGLKEAIQQLRALGIRHVELLTGDNPAAARTLAEALGIC